MIKYTVDRTDEINPKYFKDGELADLDRIPPAVLIKLEESDSLRYDDMPEKPRCLFCEAPGLRSRHLHGHSPISLCEEHYYSKSLGKIVAELRRIEVPKPKFSPLPQKRRTKKRRKIRRQTKPVTSSEVTTQ